MTASYSNLTDALTEYVKILGKKVYDRSQELVPVKSGRLKKSGSYSFEGGGATVRYKTPYAYRINAGFTVGGGGGVSNPSATYTVRQHQRRVPRGSTIIREHEKRVGERKPQQSKRKGFLTRAKEDIVFNKKGLERAWAEAHGGPYPSIQAPRIV